MVIPYIELAINDVILSQDDDAFDVVDQSLVS